MHLQSNARRLIRSTLVDWLSCWKSLALTDIVFKIIAFIVLTPIVGFLFRALIALSSGSVLSDLDILHFFLGPVGWCCALIVGALWLGILALEQTALMGIVIARQSHQRLGTIPALRFASVKAWPVIRLTGSVVAWTLLTIAPFG